MALGANKVSACLGTGVALGNFARSRLVLWRVALAGLGFSLLGSWVGSRLTLLLDAALLGKILVALLPVGLCATLLPQKDRSLPPLPLQGPRFWLPVTLVCLLLEVCLHGPVILRTEGEKTDAGLFHLRCSFPCPRRKGGGHTP